VDDKRNHNTATRGNRELLSAIPTSLTRERERERGRERLHNTAQREKTRGEREMKEEVISSGGTNNPIDPTPAARYGISIFILSECSAGILAISLS